MVRTRTSRNTPGRPTQADVARHAGVSVAVVSTVVNGRQYGNIRVSDDTKARVTAAIDELGYAPDPAARVLAGGTNQLLGVFTFEPLFPSARESFFYDALIGIEGAADELGYNLLLLTGSRDAKGERSLFLGGSNGMRLADGGILVGWDDHGSEVSRLARSGYPFVFLGQREYPGVDVAYVGADYTAAVSEITCKVVESGFEPVYIRSVGDKEPPRTRLAGFEEATRKLDIAPTVLAVDRDAPLDDAFAHALRSRTRPILLVESRRVADELASDSMSASVPIVDLSGAPGAESARARIEIPLEAMGRESVRLLTERLADPQAPLPHELLPCRIVWGSLADAVRQLS